MIGKDGFPEANATGIFIHNLTGPDKPDMNSVEMGVLQIPESNVVKLSKRYRVARRILDRFNRAVSRSIGIRIE